MAIPFITGYSPAPSRLLSRFLPPIADGVAARYVERFSQRGDIVLDPFGQSAQTVVEALHLERRVVVANFNPVSRLALSLALRPPTVKALTSVLTLLADAPKEGGRLENWLRRLYRTTCADCGSAVMADWFEWDSEANEPLEKAYHCRQCGGPPKRGPADDEDRALAKRFARGGLDYHFLLDRVATLSDPDRPHAEEALAVYPPRAQAAMAAALVKLDSLNPPADTRRLLCGLLIAAFDAACVLAQERPKVLTVPRRFRESNFWLALENAVGLLAGSAAQSQAARLADLLERADAPAVYAHAGPARDLMPLLPEGACPLAITAVPRPNQAYWTLSALWSAWLWGRDSASTLRSVLRRRRYDWVWHTNALRSTLSSLRPGLRPGGALTALMGEAEPGFAACLFAAADLAGYALTDAVLRADSGHAQFIWSAAPAEPAAYAGSLLDVAIKDTARQAAAETLLARGEPSRWAYAHFGAWRALAEKRLLSAVPEDTLASVNRLLEPVFRDSRHFQRLGAGWEDDAATGFWYLPDTPEANHADNAAARPAAKMAPLADRVEAEVLRLLSPGADIDEQELIQTVCLAFPGVHTPGRNLVLACLNSYAEKGETQRWRLRPEDASAARAAELESIQAQLRALAARHGYGIAGANPLEWREADQTLYLFAVITSAVVSTYLLGPRLPGRKRFLVLPGGRAGLVAFKVRRDPRLRQALVDGNWLILKFRHVRRMAGDTRLTRATLEPAFYDDPLDEAKQLALIADD